MLIFLSTALAASVAVLPLEQGAGGTPYAGLGTALAGMLTSDLAGAPGLTLVERSRLDALLAEIDLGPGGFVDPATAQTLGKGLGAEYVVVGSYSVVGEQFLLDARLVAVESATVTRAASAAGVLSTFVDVEKTLVGGLLDGLDVRLAEDARRKLLAAAPTRDFDAFAAYGEGLAAEKEGHLDEARAAYAEALSADPDFTQASTALGGLRMALDAAAARRVSAARAARATLLEKVITTFPVPTDPKDRRQRAGFVLRLAALDELGRDCQRASEMEAYLDVVGWKLGFDKGGYEKLVDDVLALAVDVGLTPGEKVDPRGYADVRFSVQTEGALLFRSVGTWFYAFPTMLLDVPTATDLTGSMARCLTAPEQVAELGRLAAAARTHGVGDETVQGYPVGLADRFAWSALAVRARSVGLDDAASARLRALVEATDDTTPLPATGGATARMWVEGQARQITQDAVRVEQARAWKLGWSDAALAAAVVTLAEGDPAAVPPPCVPARTRARAWAQAMAGRPLYPGVAAEIVPLADLGCLPGRPARFATPEEAVHWVEVAPSRARVEFAEACAPAFAELPRVLHPPGAPPLDLARAVEVLTWYDRSLVGPLCVSD